MINLFPDKTLIFQWLIFMAAVAILTFGIFLPTLRIINERRARTSGRRGRAHQLGEQASQMAARLDEMLENAKREGHVQKGLILSEGTGVEEEMIRLARQEVDKIVGGVRETLKEEVAKAKKEVPAMAAELGREIAVKLLDREVL